MIRQHHDGIDLKWMALTRFAKRPTQQFDMIVSSASLPSARLTVKKKHPPGTKLRRYAAMPRSYDQTSAMGFARAQPIYGLLNTPAWHRLTCFNGLGDLHAADRHKLRRDRAMPIGLLKIFYVPHFAS